ncbi:MAG: hydroxymethylbilane synthase [Verrucomicrobiales bacterium]|nr:hydroxymethylbilane synthase [Verrucomicrobiales bacterium]
MTDSRPPSRTLRLGTRRSLLAQAQSSWVARQLEAAHPGLHVELVGVETRGDAMLDVPLSTAPGREFFVAELDAALLARQVDFAVHSHKDLSLDRPSALVLAATPRRADPRDAILFGPSTESRLARRLPLRIGTGAPRRIENLADFLPAALPGPTPQPAPVFVPIRGNVDTRLSRVHLPESEERHLDGVVLALAGLCRLAVSDAGRSRLAELTRGVRWMVLPLRECPTAPAQGALAVECRADDPEVRRLLAALDHPPTARHVERERRVLASWGGGCHLALGATSFSTPDGGSVLHVRGRKPDGTPVAETRIDEPEAPTDTVTPPPGLEASSPFLFVAAAPRPGASPGTPERRVWAGDLGVWHALARSGTWVEGCAEGFGLPFVASILAEPVVRGLEPSARTVP